MSSCSIAVATEKAKETTGSHIDPLPSSTSWEEVKGQKRVQQRGRGCANEKRLQV